MKAFLTMIAATAVLVFATAAGARPAALDVTITSGPEGTVAETTAVFGFAASIRTASFTCSVDGAAPVRCASPVTYAGLAPGAHTFLVTAEAGRERASARRLWTIAAASPPPPADPAPPPAPGVRLLVAVDGAGTVSGPGIACPGDCEETLPAGTGAQLAQQAGPAAAFAGWAGACEGAAACMPTLAGTTFVRARFVLAARPPAGRADRDRDGMTDARDGCPATPRGAKLVRDGCALVDLVGDADVLLRRVADTAGVAERRLRGIAGLAPLAAGLARNLAVIERGGDALERGEVCAGAALARTGARGLAATASEGAALIARLQAAVRSEPGAADTDGKDLAWAGLHYRQRLLDDAAAEGALLRRDLDAACAGLGARAVLVGRIAETDDAERRLRLEDGSAVALGRNAVGGGGIWRGGRARIVGRRLGSGPVLAESVTMLDTALPKLKLQPCTRLLIAPVQDFLNDPTPVLHETKGYRAGGVLWLEAGMRFAASPKCAGAKSGRYSLRIVMDGPGQPITVAPDLDANDGSVAVPVDATAGSWTLTVTERYQASDCAPPQPSQARVPAASAKSYPCPVQPISTTTFTARVLGTGAYGAAVYSATSLPVEANGFALTKVVGLTSLHSSIPAAGFAGEAFKATPTQIPSSFQTVSVGEEFVVLPDAWYGAPLLLPLVTIGVDHLAGVVWPRLVGTRNGAPFRYGARLPTLITDLLPGCPAANCFFRLPWTAGEAESTTQGNGPGAFSHNDEQQFAFDFVMPLLTPIRATRGGTVGDLVESNSENANPCAFPEAVQPFIDAPSNYVRVDHQDGTFSYYAHVVHQSVVPQIGDTVARGDLLALTGNVGRSCGPHLHYQVAIDSTNTIYGQTTQICFEGVIVLPLAKLGLFPCFIPATDDFLVSTNG